LRYVLTVLPDASGAVWIGSFKGGLGRLNTATGTFTHLRYDGQDPSTLRWGQVGSIYRGASGTLWAGTEEGLIRLDADGREVTRYRRAEGLPSPTVNDVLEDTQGRLWVTTAYGLTWFRSPR
jgi:ligand-binding sensor domain-containing protein